MVLFRFFNQCWFFPLYLPTITFTLQNSLKNSFCAKFQCSSQEWREKPCLCLWCLSWPRMTSPQWCGWTKIIQKSIYVDIICQAENSTHKKIIQLYRTKSVSNTKSGSSRNCKHTCAGHSFEHPILTCLILTTTLWVRYFHYPYFTDKRN